jgi:MFS transporter, AAHS family, 4-hydroxybenzoate transporter
VGPNSHGTLTFRRIAHMQPRTASVDVGHVLDEGPWSRPQQMFVLLTALTIVFDGIDNQLLPVAVPAMMREWSLERGAFAPVLASGMIGMMLGGALAGVAGDRLGRRVALLGSVIVFGVLTLAAALADGVVALAVLRFVAGLGLGGAMPNAAALASEYVPRRHRPFAVTLTIVCVPLGGSAAAFMGGQILPAFGWRVMFTIGGLLPLALALVLWRALPESPRFLARHQARWPELSRILRRIGADTPDGTSFVDLSEKHTGNASVRSLFIPELRRDTFALWGAFFACMLAVYTVFNWMPAMMTGAGLHLSVASNGLLAFNLGGVAGAVAGGLAIARIGSRPIMLTMTAAAAAGAVVLATMTLSASSPHAPIIAMLGVTGGLINAAQTTMYALAAHVYPTSVRATGVGTAVAVGRIGGVLSTYAGALAIEAGGSGAFFATVAGAMLVSCCCLALVRRHVPRLGSSVAR